MERIERREMGNARIPLTGIPVELGDDELPGGFEADARDLGVGGVGLRSAFLPKIGSRLHCRFRHPEDGTPIEARGEVVWTDEVGPYEGAFGLRFESLDGSSAGALDRLVGEVATIDRRGRSTSIRDDAEAPEAARVVARDDGGAWTIPSPADLEGRSRREAPEADRAEASPPEASPPEAEPRLVELELDGVAQALTAELVHAGEDVAVLEQSLDFLTLDRRVSLEGGREGKVAAVELRLDGGVPRLVMTLALDQATLDGAALEQAAIDEAVALEAGASARVGRVAERSASPVEPSREASAEVEALGAGAAIERADACDEEREAKAAAAAPVAAWVDRPSERPAPEKAPADVLREGIERLGPLFTRVTALFAAFLAKAKPAVARGVRAGRARGSEWIARLVAAGAGLVSRGAGRARRFGGALPRNLVAQRSEVRLPARRPQRRRASSSVPLEARSRSRSQLVVGIGVAFALLFGGGLLVLGDEVEVPVAEDEAGSREPRETGAPARAEAESSAEAYGAREVPRAMIFDLVLESPVARLEGRAIEDGIVVRLPGGRAVSRAGAIAANHPDIEYAAIRNLDDGAELELRFVPGREPSHRVELRGSIVRVALSP